MPFNFYDSYSANMQSKLPSSLCVDELSSHELIILRLFVGSLNIEHTTNFNVIKQRINYGVTPPQKMNNSKSLKKRLDFLDGIGLDDLAVFFGREDLENKEFYKNIKNELSFYFYFKNKQSYSTAFVYLYRLMEKISYAFPLIYAQKTTDFKGSFTHLTNWIKGQGKQELGFFKTFLVTIFKNDPLMETTVDFDLSVLDESWKSIIFSKLKKIMASNSGYEGDNMDAPDIFSVKFLEVGSFLITIRNRFFHNKSEQDNIISSEFVEPDEFFKNTNDLFLGWLSIIYFRIFEIHYSSWERTIRSYEKSVTP